MPKRIRDSSDEFLPEKKFSKYTENDIIHGILDNDNLPTLPSTSIINNSANDVNTPSIVKFTVKSLASCRPVNFDFDINDSLENFMKKLGYPRLDMTLVSDKKSFIIYRNDFVNNLGQAVSLKEFFNLHYPEFILNKNELTFTRILRLSRFPMREGELLFKYADRQVITDDNETPSILLCPITLELISHAFKLNNRFYDFDALCEHLANEYQQYCHEHQFDDGQAFRMRCPLRMEIPQEIFEVINQHFEDNATLEIRKDTMYYALCNVQQKHHQAEYDELLRTHGKEILSKKDEGLRI